jgi:glyoxylase-like metal-dependent hydrolase (beta-lactamase superfamily II)
VGDVEVVRIEDDDFALPSAVPVPSWAVDAGMAPDPGSTFLAFTAYGIRSGDTRIVVDPWIANDFPRSLPDADERSTRLLDQLAAAGFPADDVDVAVLTHVDGRGWFTRPDGSTTFANARHLIARDEDAAVRRHEEFLGPDPFDDLLDAIGAEPVDPPVDLTDEVSLQPAPGHNYGHVAVRIESGGELAVLPGHLFLNVFEVADPTLSQFDIGIHPDLESTRRAILDEWPSAAGSCFCLLWADRPAGRHGSSETERPSGSSARSICNRSTDLSHCGKLWA